MNRVCLMGRAAIGVGAERRPETQRPFAGMPIPEHLHSRDTTAAIGKVTKMLG